MNPGLLTSIPALFALGAALAPRHHSVRWARNVSLAALALLTALAVLAALGGTAPSTLVRVDLVTWVVLTLVQSLAVVVTRYSEHALAGEPGLRRYARALLVVLAAVTTLVLSNDLALIGTAWMVTSLALHHLLTFYPDRAPAVLAAHKKFVLSRVADVCVLAAVVLVGHTVGSLSLDALAEHLRVTPTVPPPLQAAAVLLVLAVSLKSAQLPFHGWLTQVMEAPTPVSALLHAGVVNLGGVVLLRTSVLVSRVPAAQAALVVVGLTTAVVAALVMMTRVSVKLSLAWSTCAQLGFMLVQCGLGAWQLALLHLVAHSLYKAHAFLSAGSAVEAWRVQPRSPRAPAKLTVALMGLAVLSVTVGLSFGSASTVMASAAAVAPVLTLSLLGALAAPGWRALALVAARGLGLSVFLLAWHALTADALPHQPASWVLTASVGLALAALLALQLFLQLAPSSRLARTLQPRLFSGFELDERLTRWLLARWPVPTPAATESPAARLAQHVGAR